MLYIPLLLLKARKFAVLYTLGSLFVIFRYVNFDAKWMIIQIKFKILPESNVTRSLDDCVCKPNSGSLLAGLSHFQNITICYSQKKSVLRTVRWIFYSYNPCNRAANVKYSFQFCSFAFLWGPYNHMKHLFSAGRLPFTTAYFGTLFATLYFSLWVSNYFVFISPLSLLIFIYLCCITFLTFSQDTIQFF